ncbi:MAG: hypothetical protein AAFP79_10790 [Pseudomonadota bacterium]
MKATYFYSAAAVALTFAIAACIPASEPPPPPPPPPVSATTPTPTPTLTPTPPPPVSEPEYDNYLDAPTTSGSWTYLNEPDESLALFGENPRAPVFMVRCGDGAVSLGRVIAQAQSSERVMNVQAETVSRQLQAGPVPEMPIILAADVQPRDPLLDAIAITKGRFMVGVEGERTLYLPAWVEVSRVIEDCR